jgi:uncharacterized repeat protein (TIGR01451 family)
VLNLKSKIKYYMFASHLFKKVLGACAMLMMALSLLSLPQPVSAQQISQPPTEPNCQATSTTPVWNPFPLITSQPNPQINTQPCQDMPMLSFFPIQDGNPRSINVVQNQNISFHLYYINGANPGSPAIQSPTAKVQVVKLSDTKYTIKATLTGTNTNPQTVTSAEKGGDLILNVPAGTQFDIVGRNTLHYPDAMERLYQANTNGGNPYDQIPDNSVGTNVSNPIYTEFTGKNLPSTNGFVVKPNGLEAGFLGYGYILGQISATVTPQNNQPPSLPGEEITIIRGDSGSFQPFKGTDPENDLPITYEVSNLPNFCTLNQTTNIVSCQSNAQTPVRSTFTVIPIDSKGARGNPATFIVNIIEPGLNLTKICFKKNTETPCNQAGLKAGDQVTYKLEVKNSGSAPAKNVIVTDTYDKEKLTDIVNIDPNGTHDQNAGTIVWQLGELAQNAGKVMTFDASIRGNVQTGTILNVAVAKADGIPEKRAQVEFPIGANIPTLTSEKICLKKGTNTQCNQANLTIGSQVVYLINVKNNGTVAATNVKVVDSYDKTYLTGITKINPEAQHNTNDATITWQLGTVNPNETKTVSFEATVGSNVPNGTVIVNTARITADGIPEQIVKAEFPVNIATVNTPRSGGTAFLLTALGLLSLGAGVYYYKKNNKLAKGFVPKRTEEVKIEVLDNKNKPLKK